MVDWDELRALARRLEEPGPGPGSIPVVAWQSITVALEHFLANEDWSAILRLRSTFTGLFARDTVGGLPLLKRLDDEAIAAAKRLGDRKELAHLLGAKGHNLHRQGFHQASIDAFETAAQLYQEEDEPFEALKNYYMTSLCHRALGNRGCATQILDEVLRQIETNDPWRGNPLQVKAWLAQDTGDLNETEQLLRQALDFHQQAERSEALVAGALSDLGEVVGLRGDPSLARRYFKESLAILREYQGQYERQEARTLLKQAELLIRYRQYEEALRLLDEADDKVRIYGHYYDLMWRIELARALIYSRQGRFRVAYRKWQATLRFRHILGLPKSMLVRQIASRLVANAGLPR